MIFLLRWSGRESEVCTLEEKMPRTGRSHYVIALRANAASPVRGPRPLEVSAIGAADFGLHSCRLMQDEEEMICLGVLSIVNETGPCTEFGLRTPDIGPTG